MEWKDREDFVACRQVQALRVQNTLGTWHVPINKAPNFPFRAFYCNDIAFTPLHLPKKDISNKKRIAYNILYFTLKLLYNDHIYGNDLVQP